MTTKELKLISLRECPQPESMAQVISPDMASQYWHETITKHPAYNGEVEQFYILCLNTINRVRAHVMISMGTMDTLLVHPREVFRPAILAGAHSIVLMHNHPSGDPTPSEADVKVTRDLVRAGELIKISVHDHVIVGAVGKFYSLKQLGYFQ